MPRFFSTGLAAAIETAFFSGVLLLTGADAVPGVCLVLLLVSWTVLESAFQCAHCDSASRRETAGTRESVYGVALLLTLILCAIGFLQFPPPSLPLLPPALGAAIAAAGIALRLAAIARLGPHFHNDVEVAPGQPLVSDGVYRRVRHPGELGVLFIVTGACILTANPVAGIFAALAFFPLVLDRIRREDRLLKKNFGPHFAETTSRAPTLAPTHLLK